MAEPIQILSLYLEFSEKNSEFAHQLCDSVLCLEDFYCGRGTAILALFRLVPT